MAKLHWFPFYYLDWLSDSDLVMMTYSEKGLFIDMLSRCYNEDGLSSDTKKLMRLFKCDADDLSECMKMFYIKDEKLFNKKLDNIKKDQKKISTSRSAAGKKSAEARKAKRLMKSTSVEQVLDFVDTNVQQNSTNTVQYNTEQNNKEKDKQKDDKLNSDFEIFWADYPKKENKPNAKKTLLKYLKSGMTIEKICEAMNKSDALRRDKQFIPNPQAWLNAEPWNDEDFTSLQQELSLSEKVAQRRLQQ